MMTESAERFIGPATFAALSGRPVATSLFDCRFPLGAHIELARWADLFLVAPATANLISKAALGMADDLLSTLMLSFDGPVFLAPAMNAEMWAKPSVQRNVQRLRDDGVKILGPNSGWQSCRDQGEGRMVEPDEILEAIAGQIRL